MDYYIESGVRRCVAARELGLVQMIARLHETGKPPTIVAVQLAELHSPKAQIHTNQRYQNVVKVLSTRKGRASMAKHSPIDIQILGADATQAPTVPLKDVQLLPEAP